MTSPGALLLAIEDEPQMRRFLRASLTSHGFRVVEATSAQEGIAMATSHHPEAILLDLGLPDQDGITVTRTLRQWSRVPIIVISARGRETDKVEALDAGADDYLTKPFGINELLARIRVALRHAQQVGSPPAANVEVGSLRIDLPRRRVTIADREVHLTPIEYRLLVLLAQNAGKVLTHQQLLKEGWGRGYEGQTQYLRVYMAQLRRKIEADPARPRLLATEPGVGYRLRDEPG
jgi:two-component system, OmpR family, KDP operon response regulator KdpE